MRRALVFMAFAGCLGPQDDPSQVHDLRVIGAQFDPPEVMAPSCAGLIGSGLGNLLDGGIPDGGFGDAGIPGGNLQDLLKFAVFAQPIQMKWLVLDPQGRDIDWTLRACTSTGDLECNDDGGFVDISAGTMKPGTLTQVVPLGASFLTGSIFDGGTPLLLQVISNDTYKGLGGFRTPVVLHVTAGDEQVYAQKLMVYSCKMFDAQVANVQPIIPGLHLDDGGEWPASTDGGSTAAFSLQENTEFKITPDDFGALEEDYVVPSLSLKPVHLHESWKFSWYTSLGRFNPTTSGGTDFTGMLSKPYSRWLPRVDGGVTGISETDVDFWIVVRDGRGGESWIERRAHLTP